jgi:hypothetical protein
MNDLLPLLLALLTQELLHVISEVFSAREKVKRLDAYLLGKTWKEMKLKIDSRPKAMALSLFMLLVLTLPLWGLFSFLDLSIETSVYYAIAVTLITYWIVAIGFDRYHVDIERVTRRYKK